MPSWEEIVAHMQGKELSFFDDAIVRVIDSQDHARRVIILRSDHGYYKTAYEYEEIRLAEYEQSRPPAEGGRFFTFPHW